MKLEGAGLPCVPIRTASTKSEAAAAAKELGPPFRVYTPYSERFALHAEDIGLALAQTLSGESAHVALEHTSGASILNALLCVHPSGQFRVAWFETRWMSEVLQFPIRIRSLKDEDGAEIPPLDLVEKILSCLNLCPGPYKIDFLRNQSDGWLVRQIEPLTMSDWLPLEWWQTELGHSILTTIVQCLSDSPLHDVASERQSTVQWLETHSGTVLSVEGEETARSVAGIGHVELTVQPGDIMRHVVDLESRDKVGFVIAEGPATSDADAAAEQAVQKIEIETQNIMETPFDA